MPLSRTTQAVGQPNAGPTTAPRACPPYAEPVQRPTLVQSIGLLAAVSLVSGIVVAGMLLPFVGGAGLVARSVANDFAKLPSTLTAKPLPQVSRVLAADGSTIATFYSQYRFEVPLAKVPLDMQRAIIDIEDHSFYEH